MGVELTQEQSTYCVSYKGEDYTVIRTTHHFNDYTEDFVLLEGEEVEDTDLVNEILDYLNDSLG